MQKKIYLELSFVIPEHEQEFLIAFLSSFRFEGFWEDGNSLKAYAVNTLWNDDVSLQLKEKFPGITYTAAEIPDQDWNKEWEESIEPVLATEKIIVRPSWKEADNAQGKLVITIDPKMSFGTGHHETTRLMLQMVEQYMKPGDNALDLGTGTGILAIAAIKLGAKHCLAVDNDEWSIENTKENIIINGVERVIEVFHGTLETVHEEGFDIILANIQSSIILPILPLMKAKVKHGGKILLSGLLNEEREMILASLQKNSLNVLTELSESEWIAFCVEPTQKLT